MSLLLGLLVLGAIMAVGLAIFFRFFTPDDFSIWNHKWFGKDIEKDQSYLDK
jgi:hypothetical protein